MLYQRITYETFLICAFMLMRSFGTRRFGLHCFGYRPPIYMYIIESSNEFAQSKAPFTYATSSNNRNTNLLKGTKNIEFCKRSCSNKCARSDIQGGFIKCSEKLVVCTYVCMYLLVFF